MSLSVLHRKEQLIITVIDIIDELGIQKLTTKEIAKRQNVSEATLFRHFKNKNELLIAVLDYFSQFDDDIFQSAKMKQLNAVESLKYLVNSYAVYYESYPAISSILQLFEVLRYDVELSDKIAEIQNRRTEMLTQLIEDAQKEGSLPSDMDCSILAVMIYGCFREICLNWRMERGQFSLRERTQASLELLWKAFG